MNNKFQGLLAFCITILNITAQHWCPENANWIFIKQELLFLAAHGYVKYAVVGGTAIKDTTAYC